MKSNTIQLTFGNLIMSKSTPEILVVGDIILDHYLFGTTNRISPEAPVPIVECKEEKWVLGGAANVANNLVAIRAKVTLAGIIGEDENGILVNDLIKSKGIYDLICISKNRKTTTKTRIISSHHQLLRIDKEDSYPILNIEESELFKKISLNIKNFDCVIISDYSKGLLTDMLINKIIELSNQNNIKVLVDPKTSPFIKYSGAYLIKPNKKEAMLETGVNIVDENTFSLAAEQIQSTTSCEVVVITLSEGGVGLYSKNINKILPTKAKDIFDVTGAGDTFIATLAFAISKGKSIIESCEIANYASGIVIAKHGCVPVEYEEIKSFI
jgi:D-beta-D-heptose 7-phosphate kinase/D-beta-D-heptose 1-phosphate adenosyltransferase